MSYYYQVKKLMGFENYSNLIFVYGYMGTLHTKHQSSPGTQNYAIIVAGGSGTRMQTAIPKQFLLLNGKPVLMHTLTAFYECDTRPAIILVLHADHHAYWEQLCREYNFTIPHRLVNGGETRFYSVKNGLTVIPDNTDAIIAVQDAVRPLSSTPIIDNSYAIAREKGNAVVAVKSRDSVRQIKNEGSVNLPRNEVYLVQTPQTFRYAQLKQGYQQAYDTSFTDDASVVERAGFHIHIIEGDYRNIKITYPEDIAIAELLLKVHS